jgi:SAM-dependent methyltransferase
MAIVNNMLEERVATAYLASNVVSNRSTATLDGFETSMRFLGDDVFEALPNIGSLTGTLLDIGCGPGYASNYVTSGIYIGVDESSYMISHAQLTYSGSNITFLQENILTTTVSDSSIDVALANDLYYRIDNLDLLHQKVYNLLKSGGTYVIIMINPGYYSTPQFFLDNFTNYSFDMDENIVTGDYAGNAFTLADAALKLHPEQDIKDSLTTAGFTLDT